MSNIWKPIANLIAEIKQCEKAEATTSAIAMAYVCIDTMAFLALPDGREKQGRVDFITWCDTHLKGHEEQPYQYRGIDVYGARCALLHAFSTEADFHQLNPDTKRFGYHDGGRHSYNPSVDDRLVIIGTASFLNDVVHAVSTFCEMCRTDNELRDRVERRLPHLFDTFPIQR